MFPGFPDVLRSKMSPETAKLSAVFIFIFWIFHHGHLNGDISDRGLQQQTVSGDCESHQGPLTWDLRLTRPGFPGTVLVLSKSPGGVDIPTGPHSKILWCNMELRQLLQHNSWGIQLSCGDGHCLLYSICSSWANQLPHEPQLCYQALKDKI